MKYFEDNISRTLRNWSGDGVISRSNHKEILDTGKVAKDRQNKTLVSYGQLKTWGYV